MDQNPTAAKNSDQAPDGVIQTVDEDVKAKSLFGEIGKIKWFGVCSQIINLALKWFFLIWRTLFTPFYKFQIWQDLEQHSKQTMRVAYIGDLENSHYLQELIFGKSSVATNRRALYWWQLKKSIRNLHHDVDLTLVDVQFPVTLWFQDDKLLCVPRWIKQRVSIASCWNDVVQGLRRKTRKEVQRFIRKFNYQVRIVQNQKAKAFFYDRIYRPYLQKRYGTTALVVGRREFLRECRYGQILQLCRGDTVVAASMLRQIGNQLSIVWTGINSDLEDKEHLGASDVLDYFSIHYAHQLGCDFLDLGPSRPRMNDGLLRYKKKWGAMLYTGRVPQGLFVVIPHNFSVTVQNMLAAANFITLEKGRLVGKVLLPKDSDQDTITKRFRQDWADGLDLLRYYVWRPPSEMPVTDHRKIELISLSDSHKPLEKFSRSGSN